VCPSALESYVGERDVEQRAGLPTALEKGEALPGASLQGVVLSGSAARGESRESSNVDLLVVVEAALALNRALHPRRDRVGDPDGTSRLCPHFVHLPRDVVLMAENS
jgi:hypothetical protein